MQEMCDIAWSCVAAISPWPGSEPGCPYVGQGNCLGQLRHIMIYMIIYHDHDEYAKLSDAPVWDKATAWDSCC